MTRIAVRWRRVVSNRLLRRAVFGGRSRIEHLPEISAANSARDDPIDFCWPERRRPFARSGAGPRRRRIGFRGYRGGGGGDDEKSDQAGFHRLRRQESPPVESATASESKHSAFAQSRERPIRETAYRSCRAGWCGAQ